MHSNNCGDQTKVLLGRRGMLYPKKLMSPPLQWVKKYRNFPIVLGWKFKGNGQVSMGNLRETEISISRLGN